MAWYETRPCAVCGTTIGRRRFWQEKPRLLDVTGRSRDVAYVRDGDADAVLAAHVLVCPTCYFNRFGDAQTLAKRQGAAGS